MEMKFLRQILGKTGKDKIRNTVIRDELKVEEIKNDIEKINYNGRTRYAHVGRMNAKEDASA